MSIAVQLRGVTKRYRTGVIANDDVDLDVAAGSIFGLLGPNGAGKSTLVRQVTGELLPTAGSVFVQGIDVVREPLRAKAVVGVVPQEAGTFEALTAEEHLRLFGRLHGLSRAAARERAAELLRDLDLAAHASKLSMHLSGGLKRKLLVGMALVGRPPVLILDEPTTGLDPSSRREVWGIIGTLVGAGTTVLLTTHYMEEAEALCSQVAILARGRVVAQGSIAEVRAQCHKQFKATYEEAGQPQSLYGATRAEVVAAIDRHSIAEYAVMRTSLEDIYLELVEHDGHGKELRDDQAPRR